LLLLINISKNGDNSSLIFDVTLEYNVGDEYKQEDVSAVLETHRKFGVLNFAYAAFSVGKLARLAPAGKKLHEFLKGRRTAGIVERRRLPRAL